MDLNNSPSSGGPSKVVLVVGAVCFSVILAAIAYKITLSQKMARGQNANIVGFAGTTTDPNDVISNAVYNSQAASLVTDASNTSPFAIKSTDSVSDRFSKKLFSGYLYAQQTDGVTADSIGQVSDVVMSQITQSDLPSPSFSVGQVSVFVPSSKAQILNYGNSVAGVIIQNYKNIANNGENTDNLSATAKIYKNIANSIISIQAPVGLQNDQASLANSFYLMSQGMEMLNLQSTDPVQALLGIKTLKEISPAQTNVLISIGGYFKKNGIIFSNDDAGAFWDQYMN